MSHLHIRSTTDIHSPNRIGPPCHVVHLLPVHVHPPAHPVRPVAHIDQSAYCKIDTHRIHIADEARAGCSNCDHDRRDEPTLDSLEAGLAWWSWYGRARAGSIVIFDNVIYGGLQNLPGSGLRFWRLKKVRAIGE